MSNTTNNFDTEVMDYSKLKEFFWKRPIEENRAILKFRDFIEDELIGREKENAQVFWERRDGKTWTSIYVAFRKAMKRKQKICIETTGYRTLFRILEIAMYYIESCSIEAVVEKTTFDKEYESSFIKIAMIALTECGYSIDDFKKKHNTYMEFFEHTYLRDNFWSSTWKNHTNRPTEYGQYRINFKNGSHIYVIFKLKIYEFIPSQISCVIIEDEKYVRGKCIHHNKITFNTIPDFIDDSHNFYQGM